MSNINIMMNFVREVIDIVFDLRVRLVIVDRGFFMFLGSFFFYLGIWFDRGFF